MFNPIALALFLALIFAIVMILVSRRNNESDSNTGGTSTPEPYSNCIEKSGGMCKFSDGLCVRRELLEQGFQQTPEPDETLAPLTTSELITYVDTEFPGSTTFYEVNEVLFVSIEEGPVPNDSQIAQMVKIANESNPEERTSSNDNYIMTYRSLLKDGSQVFYMQAIPDGVPRPTDASPRLDYCSDFTFLCPVGYPTDGVTSDLVESISTSMWISETKASEMQEIANPEYCQNTENFFDLLNP